MLLPHLCHKRRDDVFRNSHLFFCTEISSKRNEKYLSNLFSGHIIPHPLTIAHKRGIFHRLFTFDNFLDSNIDQFLTLQIRECTRPEEYYFLSTKSLGKFSQNSAFCRKCKNIMRLANMMTRVSLALLLCLHVL